MTVSQQLGMHLPLPMNEMESAAMRKVLTLPQMYSTSLRLGISDYGEDLKYLNIYTGEEHPYTNWAVNEPWPGDSLTNVGLRRSDNGVWHSSSGVHLQTMCQKGAIDVSKFFETFDWCAAGLHNCHDNANCLQTAASLDDGNNLYQCECNDPEFYVGNGQGEDGCVFKYGSKFLIDKYNVDVTINDRYVRTQIAVSVTNKNTNNAEFYEFGVNLDEFEFISGLTMIMGDNGAVSVGDVHKEQEAEEIFDNAISNGSGGAIVETTESPIPRNTTFSVKVRIPTPKLKIPGKSFC